MTTSGLTVAAGRTGNPIHERERVRFSLLVRLADALIEQLPSSGQEGHVSRPTVYRTLGEFVDAGLLLQIDDPRLVTYYNVTPGASVADCRSTRWSSGTSGEKTSSGD